MLYILICEIKIMKVEKENEFKLKKTTGKRVKMINL